MQSSHVIQGIHWLYFRTDDSPKEKQLLGKYTLQNIYDAALIITEF